MDENARTSADDRDLTAPPAPTHDAAAPPGNPEADKDEVEKGKDKLGQIGAGH